MEQNQQQWTTIIKPRTGWFDIDLKELWQYRDLVVMFVKRSFATLYKQTILGPAWILINPLLTTVIFTVVFGNIAGLAESGVPSFLFYMAGNAIWSFFASCITGTANTFVTNAGLFGKVYFPRLTMPISQVVISFINLLIQMLMFFCFWVWFYFFGQEYGTVQMNLWVLALPAVLLLVMVMGLGVGIIVSSLTTKGLFHERDRREQPPAAGADAPEPHDRAGAGVPLRPFGLRRDQPRLAFVQRRGGPGDPGRRRGAVQPGGKDFYGHCVTREETRQ